MYHAFAMGYRSRIDDPDEIEELLPSVRHTRRGAETVIKTVKFHLGSIGAPKSSACRSDSSSHGASAPSNDRRRMPGGFPTTQEGHHPCDNAAGDPYDEITPENAHSTRQNKVSVHQIHGVIR